MWSEHDAVKVVVWRMLSQLKPKGSPQDLLYMQYLDSKTLEWVKAMVERVSEADKIVLSDASRAILENRDSVMLIKDLKVKGSSLVAKQVRPFAEFPWAMRMRSI